MRTTYLTNLRNSVLLFFMLLSLSSCTVDYCSVLASDAIIPLTSDQKHIINLGDYIRGYDLKFDTNNTQIATPWDPVNQISTQPSPFEDGYKIVNVDLLVANDKKMYRQGIIFAQKDMKNVAVSTAQYTGTKSKRQNPENHYFTLPQEANCFSGQIIDENYNVAIDCQSKDGDQDIVCYLNIQSKKVACTSIDSLNEAHDRKSETVVISGQTFLITGTYSRDSKSKDLTYLTIYHIDEDYIDFVNIIDGYQLGLDKDILISDFDITSQGNIVLNDLRSNTIYFVKYSLPNKITKVSNFTFQHPVYEIQTTTVPSILISSGVYAIEYNLASMKQITKYELDKGDNQIVNIQYSTYAVAIETSKGSLYVYQPMFGAINYLLAEVDISNKDYLLAPYSNALYLFDENKQYIHEISSGYLVLSNIDKDMTLMITAKSSKTSCSTTIKILKQQNADNVIVKQDLTNKHFKTQSDQQLSVNLQEIYSGSNLKFTAPKSDDKIQFTLQQIDQFEVISDYESNKLTQVVSISKQQFMLLKFMQRIVIVEQCNLDIDLNKVYCKSVYNQQQAIVDQPVLSAAKQRSNNDVIFAWAYENGIIGIMTYRDNTFRPTIGYTGYTYDYSSIVISQSKVFYVMKKYATIQIVDDLSTGYQIHEIDQNNFKHVDPNMVGFYPREVYVHPRNKDLFYIRFTTSLCLMTIIDSKPNTIECSQLLQKAIPSDNWDVVLGTRNMVVFTPDCIKDYSVFGSLPIQLHTIDFGSKISLPISYTQYTNTFIVKNSNNQMIYYKLGKPVVDSMYYSTEQSYDFTTEGYWTYISDSSKVYRQSMNTRLSINAVFDQKDFKEDFKFTLKVSNPNTEEISKDTDVVVVNYPTNIEVDNKTNDIVKLPTTAQNVRVPINLQSYFKGLVQSYQIDCSYCNKQIKLETMFKNPIDNDQIHGAQFIVQVSDHNVLVLSDNRLNLVSNQNVKQAYKIIQTQKKCTSMGYHSKVGVVVFCQNSDGQQIQIFSLSNTNITYQSTFLLHEQSAIQVADEILMVAVSDNQAVVLIEDNDISNIKENINKNANVKSFVLTLNADPSKDTLEFKGTLTSTSFGLDNTQPINDIDVDEQSQIVFATIGNVGLGFAKLSVSQASVIASAQIINFNQQQKLQNYTLFDSIYQQVQIYEYNSAINKMTLFVTSSSSLHMVIVFSYKENKLSLLNVAQTYNRYGHMGIINWQFITKDYILLAYYNTDQKAEFITYYPRSEQGYVNFIASHKVVMELSQILDHFVFLSSDEKLYVADVGRQATEAKITKFDVLPGFNLVANYQSQGNFDNITIKARNQYNNASTTVNVTFEGGDDDGQGIKWYTIVIIILLVLLVIGISYGMYLKMLKNRKDKKVSLLTEGEADEEV